MADLLPQDRLQPALLDRLEDNEPDKKTETPDRRVLSKAQLRDAVLRDLTWLLNAARPTSRDGLTDWPEAERSVLNYGMPSFSGETASSLDISDVERAIRDVLIQFEPRIIPGTLRVNANQSDNIMDWHNIVSVSIEAMVWAQPVPLQLMLRTQLDLESGLIEVSDAGSY
jgi:type VI secretion system protein ImpF